MNSAQAGTRCEFEVAVMENSMLLSNLTTVAGDAVDNMIVF